MTFSDLHLALIVPILCLSGCAAGEPTVELVTVMSFNVQNLFDNIDDPR